ncbi:MAG: Threonine efflux protein [Actinomycetota bacterium]
MNSVVEYAILALGLTLLPGADVALVLRTTLSVSRKAGLLISAGITSGLFIWGPAAGIGAAAFFTAESVAYQGLKIAGILYLLYLAIDVVRSKPVTETDDGSIPQNVFWKGFANNLFNPKAAVFYITVMPQFLPGNLNPVVGGLLLAGIHAVWAIIFLVILVFAAAKLRPRLTSPSTIKRIDYFVAVILLGFALRLATS